MDSGAHVLIVARIGNLCGKRVARRNLIFSIVSEHVGFCVWSLWSVFVLFLGKEYGLTAADNSLSWFKLTNYVPSNQQAARQLAATNPQFKSFVDEMGDAALRREVTCGGAGVALLSAITPSPRPGSLPPRCCFQRRLHWYLRFPLRLYSGEGQPGTEVHYGT